MDPLYALQLYLQAQPAIVQAMNGDPTLIQLLELAEATDYATPSQPPTAIVVRAGGGPASYGSQTLELNDQRVVMQSYGPTAHLAYVYDSLVYQALKPLTPSVWGTTYIHWVKPTLRPILLRDPDLQWPYVQSSWQMLASDLTIAA